MHHVVNRKLQLHEYIKTLELNLNYSKDNRIHTLYTSYTLQINYITHKKYGKKQSNKIRK